MEKKIAVISAILESPQEVQSQFNAIVSEYKGMVRGRTGIPFEKEDISVITIIVTGTVDQINSITGKLGRLKDVTVKSSISKRTIEES